MKTYEEMAECVLLRRDEHRKQTVRRNRAVLTACCLVLMLAGVGIWAANRVPQISSGTALEGTTPPVVLENLPASVSAGREESSGNKPVGEVNITYGPAATANSEGSGIAVIPMITSFDGDYTEPAVLPAGGTVLCSGDLTAALEHYGGGREVQYRLVIGLYAGSEQVPAESEEAMSEIDRLAECGYRTALERFYQDGELVQAWITLHAYADEISDFPAASRYGYRLSLYGETVGEEIPPETSVVYSNPNVPIPDAADAPADVGNGLITLPYIGDLDNLSEDAKTIYGGRYIDRNFRYVLLLTEDTPENRALLCRDLGVSESDTLFRTVAYPMSYLTELQEKISSAMRSRKLPDVISSGVRDDHNCIRVTFQTTAEETDPEELALLLSLDTRGNAIEVVYSGEPILPAVEDIAQN